MVNSVAQFDRIRILFCAMLATISIGVFGQSKEKPNIYSLSIPKNIQHCFFTLDKTMSTQEINLIKTVQEDSIYTSKELKDGTDFFHAWKLYEGSGLAKYFNNKGLRGSYEMYETILASYHRYLNGNEIDLENQIKRHQAQQKANSEIFLARLNRDSLNGFYIPRNIEECMMEFDRIMDQDSKDNFKSAEESKAVASAFRFHPGLWIRNNWGLWGGSRLQKYFFDHGVKEPEAMSWIILTSYYRYQNGKPIDLEKQTATKLKSTERRKY